MSTLLPLNEQGVLDDWNPLFTLMDGVFATKNMTIHWDGFDQEAPWTQTSVIQNAETDELQLSSVPVALPENPRNVLRGQGITMEIPLIQQIPELADQQLQMYVTWVARSSRECADQLLPDVQEHEEIRMKAEQEVDLTAQVWKVHFKFYFVQPSSSMTMIAN